MDSNTGIIESLSEGVTRLLRNTDEIIADMRVARSEISQMRGDVSAVMKQLDELTERVTVLHAGQKYTLDELRRVEGDFKKSEAIMERHDQQIKWLWIAVGVLAVLLVGVIAIMVLA